MNNSTCSGGMPKQARNHDAHCIHRSRDGGKKVRERRQKYHDKH